MLQKHINSKQKILKLKKIYPLSLGNFSEDFSANGIKKAVLNGCVSNFAVYYKTFDNSDIIHKHKYLMKKHNIK